MLVVKNLPTNAGDIRDAGLILGWENPLEESMLPTPVFLPGESRGQRSLVGYSPRGHRESGTTEANHTPILQDKAEIKMVAYRERRRHEGK